MASNTLVTVWEKQAHWSAVANKLKQGIVIARSTALVLGILGAVLATWASYEHAPRSITGNVASEGSGTPSTNSGVPNQGPSGQMANSTPGFSRVLSGLSVVTLALAAALTQRFGTKHVQNWIGARSVSEALKEELYLYLARVAPYAGRSGESPQDALGRRYNEIVRNVKDELKALAARTLPKPKEIPTFSSEEDYIDKRVNHQITDYYKPKACRLGKRFTLFQGAATVLTMSAAVISGAVAYFQAEWFGAWVAVATTISAALSAHAAAARYQQDSISYFSTAEQLEWLRDQYKDAKANAARDPSKSPPAFDSFVRQCEEVISIETQGWMANWHKDEIRLDPQGLDRG